MTLNIKQLNRLAKNTGCKVHNDCLTCPLPQCIYDTESTCVEAKRELAKGAVNAVQES